MLLEFSITRATKLGDRGQEDDEEGFPNDLSHGGGGGDRSSGSGGGGGSLPHAGSMPSLQRMLRTYSPQRSSSLMRTSERAFGGSGRMLRNSIASMSMGHAMTRMRSEGSSERPDALLGSRSLDRKVIKEMAAEAEEEGVSSASTTAAAASVTPSAQAPAAPAAAVTAVTTAGSGSASMGAAGVVLGMSRVSSLSRPRQSIVGPNLGSVVGPSASVPGGSCPVCPTCNRPICPACGAGAGVAGSGDSASAADAGGSVAPSNAGRSSAGDSVRSALGLQAQPSQQHWRPTRLGRWVWGPGGWIGLVLHGVRRAPCTIAGQMGIPQLVMPRATSSPPIFSLALRQTLFRISALVDRGGSGLSSSSIPVQEFGTGYTNFG